MHKRHPNSLTKADSYTSQNDDLVRRDFTAPAPGTKYISDMTEIKCADGKLYLAAILDCFDGVVVGYAMRQLMLRCVSQCSFPLWLSNRFDSSF